MTVMVMGGGWMLMRPQAEFGGGGSASKACMGYLLVIVIKIQI